MWAANAVLFLASDEASYYGFKITGGVGALTEKVIDGARRRARRCAREDRAEMGDALVLSETAGPGSEMGVKPAHTMFTLAFDEHRPQRGDSE